MTGMEHLSEQAAVIRELMPQLQRNLEASIRLPCISGEERPYEPIHDAPLRAGRPYEPIHDAHVRA